MRWPYPADGQEPWYESFAAMIAALDSSGFAAREDRHLIVGGGGSINWTIPTLSWSSTIQVVAALMGFRWEFPAGSVILEDGQVLYVSLTRAPTRNITLVPVVANQVPSTDEALVLAVRIGTRVYLRSGVSILDGFSVDDFSPSPPSVQGLQSSIDLPRLTYTQLPVPVEEVVGQFMFDGSKIPVGASVYLRCMMNPTFAVPPGAANILFYDLGPVSGPPAVPVAITTALPGPFALLATVSGLVYLQTTPLGLGVVPAVGTIVSAPRMYQATVLQVSLPGDTVDVGMASLFTEI